MSKRGRSRKDIFPQVLSISTSDQPALDDYVVQSFSLPISRVGTTVNKAQVIELLWIDYYPGVADAGDGNTSLIAFLTTGTLRSSGETCTLVTIAEDITHPRTIAPVFFNVKTTTSGVDDKIYPLRVNLTDGAGNGLLLGTSQADLIFGSANGTTAAACTIKMAYRIVEVGITEYVGIVESQSNVVLG